MNNLAKHLIHDVEEYKTKYNIEDIRVKIFLKHERDPYNEFIEGTSFKMVDSDTLMLEYEEEGINYKTVICAEEISSYYFYKDEESQDTCDKPDNSDDTEGEADPEDNSPDRSDIDDSHDSSGDGSSSMQGPDIITQGIIDSASGGGIFSSIFGM